MAIINNPNQPKKETVVKSGIIKSRPDTRAVTSTDVGKAPEFPVKITVSLVVIIVMLAVLYFIFIQPPKSNSTVSLTSIPKADISLVTEKMMRIGGLIDLLENKIIQTEKSIKQAVKLGDKTIISTLRLGLARNLNDLEKHQDVFIAELVKLHQFHLKTPGYMVKQFKELLKKSDDTYKIGNAKTISNIQRLLRSVPKGTPPIDYFKKEIKVQK